MSPIPNNSLSCSDEIKYIYNTDQSDRLVYMLDTNNFDANVFNERDSIRLTRLIQLDNDSCYNDFQTTYNAAFVYLHDGGIYMKDDSSYFKRSSELFKKASTLTTKEQEKIRAESAQSMAYNYYLRAIGSQLAKDPALGTITDINLIIDESKLDSLKNELKDKIKTTMEKFGIKTSEKDLENKVNESMKLFKAQILGIFSAAKRKSKELIEKNK
ncbi:hypothetical protein EP342_04135 [bacterium]|nr:MAG: hypothetical protein EP342_04135 [bacterium]